LEEGRREEDGKNVKDQEEKKRRFTKEGGRKGRKKEL